MGKEDKICEDLDIFFKSGSNPEFYTVSLEGASPIIMLSSVEMREIF